MDGFKNGFRIKHTVEVTNTCPKNDPSITENFTIAQQKINTEVAAGRMSGPFKAPPFETFHVSPLKLREKTTPGSFRMIHNLSWPYDDTSINSNIPDEQT